MRTFNRADAFSRIASLAESLKSFNKYNDEFDYKAERLFFNSYASDFDEFYIAITSGGGLLYFRNIDSMNQFTRIIRMRITREIDNQYSIKILFEE